MESLPERSFSHVREEVLKDAPPLAYRDSASTVALPLARTSLVETTLHHRLPAPPSRCPVSMPRLPVPFVAGRSTSTANLTAAESATGDVVRLSALASHGPPRVIAPGRCNAAFKYEELAKELAGQIDNLRRVRWPWKTAARFRLPPHQEDRCYAPDRPAVAATKPSGDSTIRPSVLSTFEDVPSAEGLTLQVPICF
jgi:hypothetical protein